MTTTATPASGSQAAITPAQRTVGPTVAIYAAIALALAGAGGLFLRSQWAGMQRWVENELSAIAELKVQQIVNWRRERVADAAFFSQASFVPRDVQAFFHNPASPPAKDELIRWMTLLKGDRRYCRVSLFDARGELRLVLQEDDDRPGPVLHAHAAEALRDPRIRMTDLHRGDEGEVHLNLSFPVFAPAAAAGPGVRAGSNAPPLLAVVVLELDPRRYLYPMLQTWPMPSRTAETLLVRREGDEVLFLNELRHRTNTALALRIPLHREDQSAVLAVRGESAVHDAVDYRGVQVLAATRPVPDTLWFMVAKVDKEEIFAPLRQQMWLGGLLAGALALAGGLGLMAVWRGRETAFLRQDLARQREAEAERQKFVQLTDSSSEFIGMCDLHLQPLYVNPAGIRMVGLPDLAAACRVKVQDYFFPEDQRFIAEEFFPRVLRDGHGEVEIRLRHFQTGAAIWVSYYLFSVRDADGRPIGWAAVGHDITERKRAETELRRLHEELRRHADELEQRVAERTAELARARDRAEAADRIKSAFLATMSHELRTPLNSIIGFTGMLLQGLAGPLNAEQTKQLRMVKESGRHLLALINDVLDISKIEAGQIEIHHAPFPLGDAIQKAVCTVSPLAEKKGLALAVRVAPEVREITSDRRRVEQILLNLLSNAIKFTERGEVTLTAEVARPNGAPDAKLQNGTTVRISVADTGIGIKAEDLPKLFQPFHQLDSGLTRQHEGTGLGLAISRRLAERLGGTLTVASEWGKGSMFTFTLPTEAATDGKNEDIH